MFTRLCVETRLDAPVSSREARKDVGVGGAEGWGGEEVEGSGVRGSVGARPAPLPPRPTARRGRVFRLSDPLPRSRHSGRD